MKTIKLIPILLALSILLCACRVRTTLTAPEPPEESAEPLPAVTVPEPPEEPPQEEPPEEVPPREEPPQEEPPEEEPPEEELPEEEPPEEEPPEEEPPEGEPPEEEPPEEVPPQEPTAAPEAPTEEDEEAERREYAPEASGELTPEAETPLELPAEEAAEPTEGAAGTSGEASVPAEGEGAPVNVEAEGAELTATETVAADEAEQLGVDESGEVADSVLTYYLTLLDSRLGSLFECKRLYVYWETAEDHRTVFNTGREHQLILGAGAYDVSAKLLEENLTVDDGWVERKNPDLIVKLMDGGALDTGAAQELCAALAARPGWAELGAVREKRVLVLSSSLLDTQAGQAAAMLYLAKLAYPEQMEDVDVDEALRALTEEAQGSAWGGTYAYSMI